MEYLTWVIIYELLVLILIAFYCEFSKEISCFEKVFFFVSFTLLIASYKKYRCKNGQEDENSIRSAKADIIKSNNTLYFIITSLLVAILAIINLFPLKSLDEKYTIYNLYFYYYAEGILFILFLYGFSRVNEIFFAFISDAREKLDSKTSSSALKYYERIKLAMVSYIELILLYGILQFVLSVYDMGIKGNGYPNCNILDAIYFSGITIATVGYGDLIPTSGLSKFLSVYEVINGVVLLVVSFTIYVSRSIIEEEYKNTITVRINKYDNEFSYECDEFSYINGKLGSLDKNVIEKIEQRISNYKKYKNSRKVIIFKYEILSNDENS